MWEYTQKSSPTNSLTFALSLRRYFSFPPMVYRTTMIRWATGVRTAQEMPRRSSSRGHSTTNRKSPVVEDGDKGKFTLAGLSNLFADHKSEKTPPLKCAAHSTCGQGGWAEQLQKVSDAITCKDKRKKAALTEIPENTSDNPMTIPPRTNCKANKVYMDWSLVFLFALNILQRDDSDTHPTFLVPPGTEPCLEGNGPIPHQSVGEESHFGFCAPSSLASVNVNLLSNTDGEYSDQGYNPIDPILRTPQAIFHTQHLLRYVTAWSGHPKW